MSPVNPDKIRSVKPYLIDYDRPCVKCGYNLVGLMSDGVCPECGRKIVIKQKNIPRYSDNLVNAPLSWLGVFALGGLILFFGSLGLFGATAAAAYFAPQGYMIVPLIAGGFACFWAVGVWLVTRPRPVMPATTVNPTREWMILRWSARATQLFWLITAACLLLEADHSWRGAASGPSVFLWLSIPSFAIAALGMIPLFVLVSNIAYWASDTGLAEHLRACAWTVGAAATLLVIHLINVATHSIVMGGFWASLVAGLLIIFCVAPWFYSIFCCFQLQGTARWALRNHAAADARTQRLRERAEREAARGVQPNIPVVEGVDIDAFNLGDSAVSAADAPSEPKPKGGHTVSPSSSAQAPYDIQNVPPGRPRRRPRA